MRKLLSITILLLSFCIVQSQPPRYAIDVRASTFQDAFEVYVDKVVAAAEAFETNTDTANAKADLIAYQASLDAAYDVNYELDKTWPWNNPCYVACSKEFYNCSACWRCWNACILLAGDCIRQCWAKPAPLSRRT
jgi:hypothetical protein